MPAHRTLYLLILYGYKDTAVVLLVSYAFNTNIDTTTQNPDAILTQPHVFLLVVMMTGSISVPHAAMSARTGEVFNPPGQPFFVELGIVGYA